MGKYADMLGISLAQQQASSPAGGKYAALLGLTPEKPDVGNIEGAIRGVADTGTFGFSDEIEGVARGIFTGDTIEEGIEKARARHEASPGVAYTAGQIGGALIPGLGTAGAAMRAATTGGKIAKSAAAGAGSGAVYGLGSGEGLEDRISEAATGAVIGAPLGAAGGAVATKLTKSVPVDGVGDAIDQIPLTKGQKSADLRQVQHEEALRNKGGVAQDIIRKFDDEQGQAIGRAADAVVADAGDLSVAGEKFQSAMVEAKKAAKDRVGQAYTDVRNTNGSIKAEALSSPNGLFDRMDRAVESLGLNMEARSAVQPIVDTLKKSLDETKDISIREFDDLRKSMTSEASTPTAKRAVGIIKDTFDDFLEETVTTSLFRGDDEILGKLKNARALHADYMKTFTAKRGGDKPGKIIEAITHADASPVEAVNALIGASRINMKGAPEAARRIAKASPEAGQAMKQAVWARLTRKDDGSLKDPGKMVSDINTFLKRDPFLADALVGQDLMKHMKRFSDQVGKTVTPKGALNPSHSSWAAFRTIVDAMSGTGGAAAAGVFINPSVGIGLLLRSVGGQLNSARNAKKAIRQAQQQRKGVTSRPVAALPTAASLSTLSATPGGDR